MPSAAHYTQQRQNAIIDSHTAMPYRRPFHDTVAAPKMPFLGAGAFRRLFATSAARRILSIVIDERCTPEITTACTIAVALDTGTYTARAPRSWRLRFDDDRKILTRWAVRRHRLSLLIFPARIYGRHHAHLSIFRSRLKPANIITRLDDIRRSIGHANEMPEVTPKALRHLSARCCQPAVGFQQHDFGRFRRPRRPELLRGRRHTGLTGRAIEDAMIAGGARYAAHDAIY